MKITSQKQLIIIIMAFLLLLDINITTTKTTYILQIKSTDRPSQSQAPAFFSTQKQTKVSTGTQRVSRIPAW